jgi:iron complex transport system substrate-binding protein
MRRPSRIVLALLAAAVVLVGCRDEQGSQPAAPATITIVDTLDRRVQVPAEVRRVVSLNSDLTEVIVALGGTDKLVSGGYRVSQPGQAWISERLPRLATLPSPSSPAGVNLEQLAALRPDLIVSTLFGEIASNEVLDTVGKLGIPIVIIGFERLETYLNDLDLLARTLGLEDRGGRLREFLSTQLDEVTERTEGVSASQRVRVYHGLTDVYHSLGKGIFEHDQIAAAGGLNVAAQLQGFGAQVSPEQLQRWNPDVIVLLWEGRTKDVLSDRKVSGLQAVKAGRVYRHPEQGWGFATPRSIFAIPWLADKLYPARFADVDLEAKADAFYTTVYGFPYSGPSLD